MEKDPHELTNLITWDKLTDKKEELKGKILKWMESIDDPLLNELENLPKAGLIIPIGVDGP